MNKRKLVQWLVSLFVLVVGVVTTTRARADGDPTGYWTTVHDDGKTEKAVVEIINERGTLRGRIVRLINPPIPNPPCEKCSGAKKGRPIIGLEFLWGLKKDGNEWSGGRILDPETGNEYSCFIEVIDGGKRLKVRGYLGIALLGRTQYWHRAKASGNK
jgi:uncharacterized protein (DUF2147 family)